MGMWDPPAAGIKPMSPALVGEILYHQATGEAPGLSFYICKVGVLMSTHRAAEWIKRALSGTLKHRVHC